jgi:aspartyl/asparaginyl beta-hydroxylase (cupin superfamily)
VRHSPTTRRGHSPLTQTQIVATKRKKAWYIKVGRRILKPLDDIIARNSLVGTSAFFDPADFAWAAELEANWPVIRAELDGVLLDHCHLPNLQDISVEQRHISTDDGWKSFFLYGYGYRSHGNCERCPETARLIEAVPGMSTAFFSILAPGKHLPAHRGPYKGVLRYHLALMVPEPREKCRIRVGEGSASWQEGKSMMFDDTYEHEVWNETDGMRVVLFLDVARPLKFPASLVNQAAFSLIKYSPLVQRGRKNIDRFHRQLKNKSRALLG